MHLLSLEPKGWKKSAVVRDVDACTGCGKCEHKCLFNAINVVRDPRAPVAPQKETLAPLE